MKNIIIRTLLTLLFLQAATGQAYSNGPGSLDLTFAGSGYISEGFGNSFDYLLDSVLQPDGKIVSVGYTTGEFNQTDVVLGRHNSNGALDPTFGNNGKLIIKVSTTTDDRALSAALQADGKIVVAGYVRNGSSDDILVLRFNANGTPDLSFDGDGKAILSLPGSDDRAEDVAIQADGKIVLTGSAGGVAAVVRYNGDGSLDTGFGGGTGIIYTTITPLLGAMVAILAQPDGKIITGGHYDRDFAIARYNNDGTTDATFGTNGFVTTPVLASGDFLSSIALMADGRIVATGRAYNETTLVFAIVRYNANGSLDTSLGGTGKVIGDQGVPNSVSVQPNGSIVAAGSITPVAPSFMALVRWNSDGTIDSSFGQNGRTVTNISNYNDSFSKVLIQPDGKLIAAGTTLSSVTSDFAVLRYNINGSLDTMFGGDGIVLSDFGNRGGFGRDAAVQPDGKIITLAQVPGLWVLTRYNKDGSRDAAFGEEGQAAANWLNNGTGVNNIVLQPDGKIVDAGFSGEPFGGRASLFRHNSDGSPDASFGTEGRVVIDVGFNHGNAKFPAIGPDGKITFAAYGTIPPDNVTQHMRIVRVNTDGSVNTVFNPKGTANIYISKIVVQADGKTLIGGHSENVFTVARYNVDGSPDTSFDGDGRATIPGLNIATGMALSADGKITVSGRGTGDVAVVRFNSDGSLDTSFDGDGIVTTPVGLVGTMRNDVAIQTNGKIVVFIDPQAKMSTIRYNADGSLDTSYGNNGVASFDFGNNIAPIAMGLDDLNNAVIVGASASEFLTARITSDHAPQVDVGGRLTSSTNGQGIGNAQVILTDGNRNSRIARTNSFGYYQFTGVSLNESYTVLVSSKRYRFQPPSQTITVLGSLANVDFTGNPGSESREVGVEPDGMTRTAEPIEIVRSEKARRLK